MALEFSPEARKRADEILSRYPQDRKKSAVVPLLHLAQEEWGYVTPEAMVCVADMIGCSPVKVAEIATFYPMYNKQPVGKYEIHVCHTLPCALTGCAEVLGYLSEKLGLQPGETGEDKRFTLKKIECLAACDRGPVMLVNKTLYTNLTPEKIDDILKSLE
ncbi:MAG: NAD(P)H-dependent oxidoreductase subunit E [candidate division Zixibacteria bacterium]|nr:NAD(P)H-dependent oxidoreductase subunit E [candidate division Zixibacteria bacterium]